MDAGTTSPSRCASQRPPASASARSEPPDDDFHRTRWELARAVLEAQSFENRMLKAYIRDWPAEQDETTS